MPPREGIDRRVAAGRRAHATAAELRRLGDAMVEGRINRLDLVELCAQLYLLADTLTTVLAATVEEDSGVD